MSNFDFTPKAVDSSATHQYVLFTYRGERKGANKIVAEAVAKWSSKGYKLDVETYYCNRLDIYEVKIIGI